MYKNKKVFFQAIALILFTSLLASIMPVSDSYASAYSYKYYDYATKKTLTYSNTKLNYICNGSSVDLTKTPAMLSSNGVALCSLTTLFSGILGLTCSYSASDGSIIITDGETKIVMQIGSKTATVNGEAVTINAAPVKVKYAASKLTRVLVPTRFVCETFGFDYIWSSSAATITIKSSVQFSNSSTSFSYNGSTSSVYCNGVEKSLGSLPVIESADIGYDTALYGPAKKIFTKSPLNVQYTYDADNKSLKLERGDITVIYTLNSTIAYVNGVAFQLPAAPDILKNTGSGSYALYIPLEFTAKALGFEYTEDSSQQSCSITSTDAFSVSSVMNELIKNSNPLSKTIEYFNWNTTDAFSTQISQLDAAGTNYLTCFSGGCDNYGEYVLIKTKSSVTPVFAEDAYSIHLLLNNVVNTVGDQSFNSSCFDIDMCMVESPTDSSACIIIKKPGYYTGYTISTLEDGTYCLRMNNQYSYEPTTKDNEVTLTDNQIYIPLPEGVSSTDVSTTDKYWAKQIVITLGADYSKFYSDNEIVYKGHENISSVKAQLNSNKKTEIIITTTTIQGFKTGKTNNGLIMTVDDPGKIYDAVVVLDPGHGGYDPGATYKDSDGTTWKEKDINLSVLTYTQAIFEKSNIKAYLTRIDDTFITLENRAAYPDLTDADLFISFHCNVLVNASSVPVTSAVGTGTYYCTTNKNVTSGGITSKILSTQLVSSVAAALNTKNRGITTANYLVIRETNVPSVLIEGGFMTNAAELDKLTDSKYQKAIAQNIYNSVEALFDTYPN